MFPPVASGLLLGEDFCPEEDQNILVEALATFSSLAVPVCYSIAISDLSTACLVRWAQ